MVYYYRNTKHVIIVTPPRGALIVPKKFLVMRCIYANQRDVRPTLCQLQCYLWGLRVAV